jgi:hypothetical protein
MASRQERLHGCQFTQAPPLPANCFSPGAGALGIGSSPATADDQRDRLLSVAIVMYWQHGVREDLTSPVLT